MPIAARDHIYKNLPECAGTRVRDITADVSASIRAFDIDDTKFVLHSWMRSLRGQFRDSTDNDYYKGMQADINAISKVARVVVACDTEQPWFILGYCVADKAPAHAAEPIVVYYMFVKNPYRRRGIATAMLKAVGYQDAQLIVTPYWSHYCKDIRNKVRLKFNPWLLRDLPK